MTSEQLSQMKEGVTRALNHWFLLIAVLAATGSHWVLLQSIAWTGMLAGNLQTTSFSQALERTFNGNHPCSLCVEITEGKQAEKSETFTVWQKFEFSVLKQPITFTPPGFYWQTDSLSTFPVTISHAPPVPPPRTLA